MTFEEMLFLLVSPLYFYWYCLTKRIEKLEEFERQHRAGRLHKDKESE